MNDSELSELEISLYRSFLRATGTLARTLEDASADLGRPVEDLDKPMARLLDVGLLRAYEGGEYSAVSPLLAETSVLGVAELELSARRAEIETRRNAIRQVIPDWAETLRQAPSPAALDVVTDPAAGSNVLIHYAEQCQQEVLAFAPPLGERMDPRARISNLQALARGVEVRVIHHQSTLRDRSHRRYLQEMVDLGAKIRISTSVPALALIIDSEVGLLRLPVTETNEACVVVVHEPSLVAWLVSTFERLWSEAATMADVTGAVPGAEYDSDQTRVAILRLMAEGEKDEAISRRLSISVRTCRRHIADYMSQVGATSRFQAGVIAARTGRLDVVPPAG